MTRFRPCIDLHSGQVKQIIGGTLSEEASDLRTNHVSKLPARHFAELYRKHELGGGHVIMLGGGNEEAAIEALSAWPGRLQVGGGVTAENAKAWVTRGAEKVRYKRRIQSLLHAKYSSVGHCNIISLPGCTILAKSPYSRTECVGRRQVKACHRPQLSDAG